MVVQEYPGILRGVLYMLYYLAALSCNALVVPEYSGILSGVLYMLYYLWLSVVIHWLYKNILEYCAVLCTYFITWWLSAVMHWLYTNIVEYCTYL